MYKSLPFLKNIDPSKIRITSETEIHITNILAKKLQDNGFSIEKFGFQFRPNTIKALKQAIFNGYVVAINPSTDAHNPQDKQLEVYIHLILKEINPTLSGIAKIRTVCRFSINHGTLTIRNIAKNFIVEK